MLEAQKCNIYNFTIFLLSFILQSYKSKRIKRGGRISVDFNRFSRFQRISVDLFPHSWLHLIFTLRILKLHLEVITFFCLSTLSPLLMFGNIWMI